MPTYFKLDKLVLGGTVTFDNLSNVRVTPDLRPLFTWPAGHPHPIYTANAMIKPAIAFSTQQVDTTLRNIPSGGLAVTNDSYVYQKLAQEAGIPDRTDTTHRRFRIPKCLVYWQTVRSPNNGASEAQVLLMAAYDGTNNPLIPQTTVQLPTTQTAPVLHGAGPVYINGTQIAAGSIQSIEASSGISTLTIGGDSEEFDRFVGVERTQPRLSIVTTEIEGLNTYGLQGTALDQSNGMICYLRKLLEDDSRVDDATAEHIALQGLSGIVRPDSTSGSGSGVLNDSLRGDLTALTDSVLPLLQLMDQVIP